MFEIFFFAQNWCFTLQKNLLNCHNCRKICRIITKIINKNKSMLTTKGMSPLNHSLLHISLESCSSFLWESSQVRRSPMKIIARTWTGQQCTKNVWCYTTYIRLLSSYLDHDNMAKIYKCRQKLFFFELAVLAILVHGSKHFKVCDKNVYMYIQQCIQIWIKCQKP